MKLIEIKVNDLGEEIAYIFDEAKGKVIKVYVDDYTDGQTRVAPRSVRQGYSEEGPALPPLSRKRVRPIEQFDDEEEEDIQNSRVRRGVEEPDMPVKRPNIIPPAIFATMKEPDMPGSAVETRRI